MKLKLKTKDLKAQRLDHSIMAAIEMTSITPANINTKKVADKTKTTALIDRFPIPDSFYASESQTFYFYFLTFDGFVVLSIPYPFLPNFPMSLPSQTIRSNNHFNFLLLFSPHFSQSKQKSSSSRVNCLLSAADVFCTWRHSQPLLLSSSSTWIHRNGRLSR